MHTHADLQAPPDRPGAVRARLERRIRRQASLYGAEAALGYVARLLELDEAEASQDGFVARAEGLLGFPPGRLAGLLEQGPPPIS